MQKLESTFTQDAGRRVMRKTIFCGSVAACLAILGIPATGQVGGGFDLTWSSIDGGGGFSETGNLSIEGTIGQPDAGVSSSGTLSVTGGLWYPATIPLPSSTINLIVLGGALAVPCTRNPL